MVISVTYDPIFNPVLDLHILCKYRKIIRFSQFEVYRTKVDVWPGLTISRPSLYSVASIQRLETEN